MTPAAASFTAVVVLHDSAADLEVLLDSLERHLPGAAQLVCVDTGSRDDGPAMARRRGCEVVELLDNPGFGAANNAGVARATRPVCVLLNPDVELLDGGLATLVGRAGGRDALLFPRLLNPDGTVQRSAHPLPGRARELLPAVVHPRLLPRGLRVAAEPWRAEHPRRIGWAVAACVAGRTDLLRRLGPFDPAQHLFFEDLDLCLRARQLGVPSELHPDVRLRHVGGHSTGPAFGGEPHDLLARRRRDVVGARLGRRALALDDAAQAATFATRAAARAVSGREPHRPWAQLGALWRARRG